MNTELVNIKINHFLLRLYWVCAPLFVLSERCAGVHQQNCGLCILGVRVIVRALVGELFAPRSNTTPTWEGTIQITPPTHSSGYLPGWLLLP